MCLVKTKIFWVKYHMKNRWIKRRELQELLLKKTMCPIQHTGWSCNTCWVNEMKLPERNPDCSRYRELDLELLERLKELERINDGKLEVLWEMNDVTTKCGNCGSVMRPPTPDEIAFSTVFQMCTVCGETIPPLEELGA